MICKRTHVTLECYRSDKGWNATMSVFQSFYREAYDNATSMQIKRLALLRIDKWGPSEILPVPPASLREEQSQDLANVEYEDKLQDWYQMEMIRRRHLQHKLEGEYDIYIHEEAFNVLRNATNLPFHFDSEEFSIAYVGYSLRMLIPSECCALPSTYTPLSGLWICRPNHYQSC